MTESRVEHHALAALKPLEVASYLRVNGWREEADLNGKGSLWLLRRGDDHDEPDATLPLQPSLGDFTLRMSELVRTLGRVEGRSEIEVLQDLLTAGNDVIRVRAPSRDAASGSLPIEQAVAFVDCSRDLVLAAACAAVRKQAFFPTRKPSEATDYLGRVRMGQTERGSFVLTILSPVAPALLGQQELVFADEASMPLERRVTLTLVKALRALTQAARHAATSGEMSALQQAVRSGVSANMCDAVAGLAAATGSEGVDVGVAWSRTRPERASETSRTFVSDDSIPFIQEAARLFRENEPLFDVEIEGFVTRLNRHPDRETGDITLEGLADGAFRRLSVTLPNADYSLATRAHDLRQRVACTGDLIKDRGAFRLDSPRHFRLFEAGEA